jgi:hypothetical protein
MSFRERFRGYTAADLRAQEEAILQQRLRNHWYEEHLEINDTAHLVLPGETRTVRIVHPAVWVEHKYEEPYERKKDRNPRTGRGAWVPKVQIIGEEILFTSDSQTRIFRDAGQARSVAMSLW